MQRDLRIWVERPANACKKDLRILKHLKRPANAYPKKKEEKRGESEKGKSMKRDARTHLPKETY